MRLFGFTSFRNIRKRWSRILATISFEDTEALTHMGKTRILFVCISVLLLLAIQEAVFNDLRIFKAKPNLVLVFVYIISVVLKARPALFFGLFTGLYIDIMYGRYLGLFALQFMLFATLIAAVSPEFIKRSSVWSMSVAFPAFFIYSVSEGFANRLLTISKTGGTALYDNFGAHILYRILPVTIYDTLMFFILYIPVRYIWGRMGIKNQMF